MFFLTRVVEDSVATAALCILVLEDDFSLTKSEF